MPGEKYVPPTDAMFADLGLVDPATGKLTFDPTGGTGKLWDEDEESELRLVDPTKGMDIDEAAAARAEIREKPAQRQSTEQAAASPWESDENPYKQRAVELERNIPTPVDVAKVRYENNVATLLRQAEEAYTTLSSQRNEKGEPLFDPRALAMTIGAQARELVNNEKLMLERTLTQPIAQRAVAQDIVQRIGGNVAVDDIINLSTPAEMEAVARRLSTMPKTEARGTTNERDAKFNARRESGVDTVESGAPLSRSVPESLLKMKPKDRIAYSLRYQSQNN